MSLHNMRPPKWSRLDNAAKIFPPISHGANTGVFRLSCELTEPADPALLQQALDETLLRYPYLKMVLRRGVFWHYLEQTNLRPLVEPEHEPPCAAPDTPLPAPGKRPLRRNHPPAHETFPG